MHPSPIGCIYTILLHLRVSLYGERIREFAMKLFSSNAQSYTCQVSSMPA